MVTNMKPSMLCANNVRILRPSNTCKAAFWCAPRAHERGILARHGTKKNVSHSRAPKGASEENFDMLRFKTCQINEYLLENECFVKARQMHGLTKRRFSARLGAKKHISTVFRERQKAPAKKT